MGTLVLLRHGQSSWNLENRFTGWWDVDLSEQGEKEARSAGQLLGDEGIVFDQAYTSLLSRAIRTLNMALEEMGQLWLPVARHWRLNERHYGGLTGLDKAETKSRFGDEKFMEWRRSYATRPPEMEAGSEFDVSDDPRYRDLPRDARPLTECLADVVVRMLPYWYDAIAPELARGRNILIAAHGNSLRALVKHLEGISEEAIAAKEIPTGVPILYELDDTLKVVAKRELGDPEAIAAATEAVRRQGERH